MIQVTIVKHFEDEDEGNSYTEEIDETQGVPEIKRVLTWMLEEMAGWSCDGDLEVLIDGVKHEW